MIKTRHFDKLFFVTIVTIQLLIGIYTNSSILSLVSSISGIITVILCAQRKLLQFPFAFLQMLTYMALAVQQRFYGELVENIFYLITTIISVYFWYTNYDTNKKEIKTRKMSPINNLLIFGGTCIGVIVLYKILQQTDDSLPFMDALSTIPAFIAQILLMLRYRENWFYWLIIDIASIIMWLKVGNVVLAIQFVFWSINCIYGFFKWQNDY